jgi:hypothetical protein
LGYHQAIIIPESEYMQQLKIFEREISPFKLGYIKIYAKNAR